MPSAFSLPSTPLAALMLVLCAGCEGGDGGRETAGGNGAGGAAAAAAEGYPFDRQAPGSANQVPALKATAGTLRYRPGCLFLDDGQGGEIGLVLPAHVTFDGRRLTGRLTTPEGEPIVREIGRFVSLSGPVIETPRDGRYSCDTERVLIADYF